MSAPRTRQNTFKICLDNFPKRPSLESVHKFVFDALKLPVDKVLRLQQSVTNNCFYVKTADLLLAQETVKKHDGVHKFTFEQKPYSVRLTMEDGGVDVKLQDLSEWVQNDTIVQQMKQYGEVLSIRNQTWDEKFKYKGVDTGAKILKMILKKPIKSYIQIDGEMTYCTYFGQNPTCKHCGNVMHVGYSCTENKKLLNQKQSVNDRMRNRSRTPQNRPEFNPIPEQSNTQTDDNNNDQAKPTTSTATNQLQIETAFKEPLPINPPGDETDEDIEMSTSNTDTNTTNLPVDEDNRSRTRTRSHNRTTSGSISDASESSKKSLERYKKYRKDD